MKNVFTYGTLMFEEVWSLVVEGHYRSAPGTIGGFVRKAVVGAEYPVLYPGSNDSVVQGIVYLDVNQSDIKRLDYFEGSYYSRQTERIILPDSTRTEAEVYVLNEEYRYIISKQDWDLDDFRIHGLKKFLGFYEGFDRTDAGRQ